MQKLDKIQAKNNQTNSTVDQEYSPTSVKLMGYNTKRWFNNIITFHKPCHKLDIQQWVKMYDFDRSQTISWLINVAGECRMSDQSLFLGITNADIVMCKLHNQLRNQSAQSLPMRLQLCVMQPQYVYAICLLMATKVTDLQYPCLKIYLDVCQQNSSNCFFQLGLVKQDFVNLEIDFLSRCDFNHATPYTQLKTLPCTDGREENMAIYLLHISTMSNSFQNYSYEMQAASSVYISRRLLGNKPYWPSYLRDLSGFEESQLKEFTKFLACKYVSLLNGVTAHRYKSTVQKFSSDRRDCVSLFVPQKS